MSTLSEQAAREGSAPAVSPVPEITAQSGACARTSVAPPSPLPSEKVTERVRALLRVLARLRASGLLRLLRRVPEFLDRPGSLAHAHPPTFARARELHHERAGRHNLWAPLRIAQLVWGYGHLLLIKPVLNALEWATFTPLRFFGAVILAVVIWHWS